MKAGCLLLLLTSSLLHRFLDHRSFVIPRLGKMDYGPYQEIGHAVTSLSAALLPTSQYTGSWSSGPHTYLVWSSCSKGMLPQVGLELLAGPGSSEQTINLSWRVSLSGLGVVGQRSLWGPKDPGSGYGQTPNSVHSQDSPASLCSCFLLPLPLCPS